MSLSRISILAWQVEMAAFLFELARQGVNVVISTHSMTILKWLEVHVKEKIGRTGNSSG